MPPRRPPPRFAAMLLVAVALAHTACATTAIMITPYDDRRPSQYQLLWADAAIVGTALAVGAPLYATGAPRSTEESVGAGLLLGAAAWATWNLLFLALLRMPDPPPRPSRYRGAR